jgi:glycosyltransferase involved in cell wall biosynthesis
VLLFQGGLHPSKEMASVVAALGALEAAGRPFRLLMIGGGRLDHPRAASLGNLPAEEAGTALAAADLALAPYDDGASGRRSSIMNTLASGLPTVSTHGTNTDPALFPPEAIRLVSPGDPAAFAAAVAELAADPAARRAMGAAARALFERRFAWPVLAGAWKPLLEGAAGIGPAV